MFGCESLHRLPFAGGNLSDDKWTRHEAMSVAKYHSETTRALNVLKTIEKLSGNSSDDHNYN